MAVIIQIRRDTEASWLSINPILAQGELGENLDNGLFKIGDGINHWTSLNYYGTNNDVPDHSSLTGLSNDDHTQYLRTDGGRQLSDDWNYGSASISGTGNLYGNGATLSNVGYVENGDIYFYDSTRNKDLGSGIVQIGCGRNSANTTNQYLRIYNDIPMDISSVVLPFNSTLVGMTMTGQVNTQSWTSQVRKNGSATVLDSLSIVNSYENHTWNKNTDFLAGDRIQVYLSGTNISYPQVMLFFRRKK